MSARIGSIGAFLRYRNKMNNEIICGIYKITSPTGRIYIGQSEDIPRRFKDYKNIGVGLQSQPRIYNSLKKYGFEAHDIKVIESCNIEDLNCRERFWQDYYDVIGEMGLNYMLTKCNETKGMMPIKIYKLIAKQVIDTATLIVYKSITHAANELNLNRRTLSRRLAGERSNITTLIFLTDYIEGQGERTPDENRQQIKVINTKTMIVYNSIREASEATNYGDTGLGLKLSGKQKNDTYFMYLKDYEKYGARQPDSLIRGTEVINIETKEEYRNITILSETIGVNYSTLRSWLNPNSNKNNPSPFRYKKDITN